MATERTLQKDETTDLISSEKVEGTSVVNRSGDTIGKIEKLMIEKRSGKVAYAVMGVGGFLGIGERHEAVPWNVLVYDTNLGIVTFLSDSEVFGAGTTQSGFTFDSPYAPADTMFDALSLNGTPFAGITQGPIQGAAVPEPGSLALFTGLSVTCLLALRRQKRA